MSPRLSVILPVFNGEKFLRQSIDSILLQSYTDFELIIVNDGSTDDSLRVIESYNDRRIILFTNEKNLGIVETLNVGIDLAKGEYIARMDSDDICLPNRFERQVQYLDENKDIGFCSASYLMIDETNKVIGKYILPSNCESWKAEQLFKSPIAHPLVVIRKAVLEQVGGYAKGTEPAEDLELWVRLSKICRGCNLPCFLLMYRVHDKNNSKLKRDQYRSILWNIFVANATSLGIDTEYIDIHIRFILGTWNEKSLSEDVKELIDFKKALISLNKKLNRVDERIFRETVDVNIIDALLSIIGCSQNTFTVKATAIATLFKARPDFIYKQIVKKISNRKISS